MRGAVAAAATPSAAYAPPRPVHEKDRRDRSIDEGGRRKSSRRAASLGLRCARNLILLRCLGRLGLLLLGLGLRRLSLELGSLGLFLVRRGRLLCGLLLRGSGLLGL
ncbi:unnamed protein product [Prorocentrum cordatum]|uniref:Uncharacterized protein n=1 Tax=Prorocentrum cordatum TaxID=2364126 RepID=A0ABN9Q8Q2_9DINO|nr:unnamed protein product [Polarella glacialis]